MAALLVLPIAVAACGSDDEGNGESSLPTGSEPAKLDPAEFTTDITNPYWPMAVGSEWVYREQDPEGELKVVVTVTDQTKRSPTESRRRRPRRGQPRTARRWR